jgi:hypothetical protein
MEGPIQNLKGILHKDNIIRIKEIKGYNCSKTTTEQGFSPAGNLKEEFDCKLTIQ